jgi:hypothetical protein
LECNGWQVILPAVLFSTDFSASPISEFAPDILLSVPRGLTAIRPNSNGAILDYRIH